jgi:hypothetical protein
MHFQNFGILLCATEHINFFPSSIVLPARPNQINAGGPMSAVLDSDYTVAPITPELAAVENREGDWKAYLQQIDKCSWDTDFPNQDINVLTFKRRCALAYLGRRAQFNGGVCNKTVPRILTPQFVADLAESNKAKRYSRYPWLETLVNLLGEIERVQDEIANGDNVISLVPASKQEGNGI